MRKDSEIQSVELVKGVKLKGRTASPLQLIIAKERVDSIKLANQSWVEVVRDGWVTMIPVTNIAQVVLVREPTKEPVVNAKETEIDFG